MGISIPLSPLVDPIAASVPRFPAQWSLADLQRHLGGIPAERIRLHPPPGQACEADVTHVLDHENRPCELVDGVLVEKTMGYIESYAAVAIATSIGIYLRQQDLGMLLGADGTLRILPAQVRIPDVAFIRWDKFPGGKLPLEPIPAVVPDLAVEVLSASNTAAEMRRELDDYFRAGVRLVWYVDPRSRTAQAFTSPQAVAQIPADVFSRLDRPK